MSAKDWISIPDDVTWIEATELRDETPRAPVRWRLTDIDDRFEMTFRIETKKAGARK